MRAVKTNDLSLTLYSEEYDETYHSVSGALDEALRKFVEPCCVRNGMKILDICFGLGYNAGMAIHKFKNCKIISLEKDKRVLDAVYSLEVPDWFAETYEKIRIAAKHLHYKNSCEIQIILGDAAETIKQVNETFNAVFLDPFSPRKNPELWTTEFLQEIRKRMEKGAILATYSCAGQVKRNLKEAGFEIKDGPVVGRRAPGTIAVNI